MVDLDAQLHARCAAAIADGVCSAAAVAVGERGRTSVRLALGTTRAVPDRGPAIDPGAIFDLASLTKPMATTAIAMTAIGRGELTLADRAARWLPVDDRITVAHLLGHASGAAPHVKLYERLRQGERAGQPSARAALVAMAIAHPLDGEPGQTARYSDLGYIALGALLERACGAPLEDLFVARVAGPLGMTATYLPAPSPQIVATELDDRGLVAGRVHDENADAGGGVAGHAGLFGTIDDVARFAHAMIAAVHDRPGPLPGPIARQFVATSAAPATSWRLGWDTPSAVPGVSHAGDRWPRADVAGHLGFTGTSLWLDLRRGRWVALLTNRVHPSRDRPEAARIKELRRAIGDLVMDALGD